MKRLLAPLVSAAALLLLSTFPAMAQTGSAPLTGSVAPAAPRPADQPAAKAPSVVQEKVIDGPVKKVDPIAKTVQVGWLFGLFSTTLEVTEGTQIAVEGATASIQGIREGDEVNAADETRDGKYVAKSIEATHSEMPGEVGTPERGAGPFTAPQLMQPKESPAPPAVGAKTP